MRNHYQMLEKMEDKLGEHHSGGLRLESAQAKAERLLKEELARLGWTQEQLEGRRKSDPAKLCIAARLRKETTLSIKAIAELVRLGKSKGANTKSPQNGCRDPCVTNPPKVNLPYERP